MKNLILALSLLSSLPAFAAENVINNVETSAGQCNKLLLQHARSFNATRQVSRQGGWIFVDKQSRKPIGEASYQPSSRRCNLKIY